MWISDSKKQTACSEITTKLLKKRFLPSFFSAMMKSSEMRRRVFSHEEKTGTFVGTCSMALSLTACGGGSKPGRTPRPRLRPPRQQLQRLQRKRAKEDAAETTAAEAAGGDMDALIEAAKAEGELTGITRLLRGGNLCLLPARILRSCTESRTKYQRRSTSEVHTRRHPRKQASRLPTYGSARTRRPRQRGSGRRPSDGV